jgi:hypothetical protein
MTKASIISDALNGWIWGDPKWRKWVRTKSKFSRVFVAFTEDCPKATREEILGMADEMKAVVGEDDEFGKVAISVEPMCLVTGERDLWDEKSRAEMEERDALFRRMREERKKPK